ncbi:glycosyltransferase [Sphingomonas sp. 4RDLI-65]|uniref:glycosyltransferase n=1 Tax=Sphingomonas sp. 4RDLI-65 TaxID=3111641 RepID=UPI003C20A087
MRLSVVLSVYNDAPFVERAVASVLGQSYADFEFIIVNDGSTDGSTDILRRLADADRRIILVEQENRGLVASLNRGFAMARGALVARMDGDDESLPDRFATQLAFFDTHPDYGVVGCQQMNVDVQGRPIRLIDVYPRDAEAFLAAMESSAVMSHPGAMISKAAFEKVGGYRALYRHCEDYDLWLRLSEVTKLCSVDEVLLRYCINPDQVTVQHLLHTAIGAAVAWEAHLQRRSGHPDPTDGLPMLPDVDHLGELDTIFGIPGIARRVRTRVAPKLLYSLPALSEGGVRLVGDYVAEGGDRGPATRAVARLLRHGKVRGAGQLATSLCRSYLAPRAG